MIKPTTELVGGWSDYGEIIAVVLVLVIYGLVFGLHWAGVI